VRLYEISSKLNGRREEDIPNRDNRLNATLLLAFMMFMFGGFIWLMLKFGWTGRGEAASESGASTDWLLNLNFIIIITVFFLTNFLLFVFAFKYVRKPGVKANWFPHSNKLELIWTVIPAFVLAIIIILGLISWNEQTSDASKDAQVIELYSKQFDWTVRMAGDDNKLGNFDYKLTNDNNPLALMTAETIQNAIDSMESGATGIKSLEKKLNSNKLFFDPKTRAKMILNLGRQERLVRLLYQMRARHNKAADKAAMDDIVFGANDTLVLCVDREVEFNFRSKDVIHSAYFPHFRAQMNTVPGMTTRFKFKPTITTKEMQAKMHDSKFNYVLMCNKICGSSHYKMKLIVVVLDKASYKKWYNKVSKSPAAKTVKKSHALYKPKEAETKDSVAPATDSVAPTMPATETK
jgi:cytochrome c oxidase subunit 2